MLPILEIAKKLNLSEEELELYGKYKAKILPSVWEKINGRPDGKLILVTAMTPTPAGEGKTVTTIGLAQGLARLGKKVVVALREPSLGPVFGIKGGATGGGKAEVLPSEEINLHFTGDFHALTSAQNLLAAMIDNHIYFGQGKTPGVGEPRLRESTIDPDRVTWHRVLDMNDRALREVTVAVGQKGERSEKFLITAASELMAVLCLSTDENDLQERLTRVIVGYNNKGEPVTAGDLKAVGAMLKLLKHAILPNLVQTTEGVPAIIHGGPFGNIAHGCNSLIATRYGLKMADYVVTEAGFGADLGAEKFFDIKCRVGGLTPALAVVVATVRALRYLGEGGKEEIASAALAMTAITKGLGNLKKHVENVKKFGVPVVVAVNRFADDSDEDIKTIIRTCGEWGVKAEISDGFNSGGEGCLELAKTAIRGIENNKNYIPLKDSPSLGEGESFPGKERAISFSTRKADQDDNIGFHPLYPLDIPLKQKIETIARQIYGAEGVDYTQEAEREISRLEVTPLSVARSLDPKGVTLSHLPICIAKTQYSFSDDPKKVNVTQGFRITVRSVYPSAGAGFIVVLTGEIMTMPGLPRHPLAETMGD